MDSTLHGRIHELDPTVWVGKHGVEAVVDETDDQLSNTDLLKVRFLRAARGGTTTETLAADLATAVDADVVEVRGNTAVLKRP